jgi:hypothetical protein
MTNIVMGQNRVTLKQRLSDWSGRNVDIWWVVQTYDIDLSSSFLQELRRASLATLVVSIFYNFIIILFGAPISRCVMLSGMLLGAQCHQQSSSNISSLSPIIHINHPSVRLYHRHAISRKVRFIIARPQINLD